MVWRKNLLASIEDTEVERENLINSIAKRKRSAVRVNIFCSGSVHCHISIVFAGSFSHARAYFLKRDDRVCETLSPYCMYVSVCVFMWMYYICTYVSSVRAFYTLVPFSRKTAVQRAHAIWYSKHIQLLGGIVVCKCETHQ